MRVCSCLVVAVCSAKRLLPDACHKPDFQNILDTWFAIASDGLPRPSKGSQAHARPLQGRSNTSGFPKASQHTLQEVRRTSRGSSNRCQDRPMASEDFQRTSKGLPRPSTGFQELSRTSKGVRPRTLKRTPKMFRGCLSACQALSKGFGGPSWALHGSQGGECTKRHATAWLSLFAMPSPRPRPPSVVLQAVAAVGLSIDISGALNTRPWQRFGGQLCLLPSGGRSESRPGGGRSPERGSFRSEMGAQSSELDEKWCNRR